MIQSSPTLRNTISQDNGKYSGEKAEVERMSADDQLSVPSVLARSHSGYLLKDLIKIRGVVKAAVDCNLEHVSLGVMVGDQANRPVNAFGTDIIPERDSADLFE